MQYYFLLAQNQLTNVLPFISTFAQSGVPCKPKGSFFGFPTWYKYLPGDRVQIEAIVDKNKVSACTPRLDNINDIWLIGLAVIEILLRIIILLAILYVMYGGLKYITARGDTGGPASANKINAAKNTVLDALFGLMIAIAATAAVAFIGSRFTQ